MTLALPAPDPMPYHKCDTGLCMAWYDRHDRNRALSHRAHHGVSLDKKTGAFVRVSVCVYHQPSEALTAFLAASPTAAAGRYQTWGVQPCTVVSIALDECAALAAIPDVVRVELCKRYSIPPRGVRGPKRRAA